jgi:predicted acyltransferase
MPTQLSSEDIHKRLLSLDFLRGFIMFLLVMESTGLFKILYLNSKGGALENFFIQFQHHPWNGVRFWDMIQPGFMFIAGTAMAFSVTSLQKKGVTSSSITIKMLKRSGWLFFWGVLSYAVKETGLTFELWNVLTQLSFTLIVAYFIFQWKFTTQIIICALLLLLTEMLYRFTNVPDYNQVYTNHHNFGNYVDLLLMNKTSRGGWVAINCIPTAVHTIAGALVGKLLLHPRAKTMQVLLFTGFGLLVLGYVVDFFHITPIIKRIATSSFIAYSLGWCLLAFAACYYFIDIKKFGHVFFFKVLSMNSIFIYLFFETVGGGWLNHYINLLTGGLLNMVNMPQIVISIIACGLIIVTDWGICYFLYKKNIFFRL